MDGVVLMLRVALSLAFVVGLLWVTVRVMKKSPITRGTSAIEVIARAQLGRKSGVALLKIGDRAVLVGITDNSVTLLGEHDVPEAPEPIETRETIELEELAAPKSITAGKPTSSKSTAGSHRRKADAAPSAGPLSGSILAPDTWKQTVEALREKTVRQ